MRSCRSFDSVTVEQTHRHNARVAMMCRCVDEGQHLRACDGYRSAPPPSSSNVSTAARAVGTSLHAIAFACLVCDGLPRCAFRSIDAPSRGAAPQLAEKTSSWLVPSASTRVNVPATGHRHRFGSSRVTPASVQPLTRITVGVSVASAEKEPLEGHLHVQNARRRICPTAGHRSIPVGRRASPG